MPSSTPAATPRKRKRATDQKKRLYVLDTNVLMHDPTSLYRSHEHDVLITPTILSELNRHNTGQTDVARNTRPVSRMIDEIIDETAIASSKRKDGTPRS